MLKPFFLLLSLFFFSNIYAQSLNDSLVQQLAVIRDNDQKYRQELEPTRMKFANDTSRLMLELRNLNRKMNKADSLNMVQVEAIIAKYGWPGVDLVGAEGNSTIFLVIQHSTYEGWLKYRPVMWEAVKKGNARASSYALLVDRIAVNQGRKQAYGSQLAWNMKVNNYTLSSLADVDHIDLLRWIAGLQPIAEYLSGFGLAWDAEQFKKDGTLPSKNVSRN